MTDAVKDIMENGIDTMFVQLVNEYNLPYGDFSPSQTFELEEIKERLGELLGDFVHQNLPEGENGEEVSH